MKHKNDRAIPRTNVIFSADLERYEGTIKQVRLAWDNLPEDIDASEREIFIEVASRVLFLHSRIREVEKNREGIN